MSNIYLKAYQWLLRAAVEILDIFPPQKKLKEEFALRKGFVSSDFKPHPKGSIWLHGASLGEYITLRPFINELGKRYGKERIVCTSTTIDGLNQIKRDECCQLATLLPIELPAVTLPFIDKIKPKAVLISETEIWPLLLYTLSRKNIPYGLINARINEKSVRLMRIFWPIFSTAVKNLSFVFSQAKHYSKRFRILGVSSQKVKLTGSFKYDFSDQTLPAVQLKQKYGIPETRPVICFGSTHPKEEEMILDALEPLWPELQATIVIAPRHIQRTEEVSRLLKQRNLDFSRASDPGKVAFHVILVDTLGELRNFYSVSDLAFIGGSLIKRGGHNMLEAAAFSAPIITGPETFNFRNEMRALKKNNAVKIVNNSKDLSKTIQNWINNPDIFKKMGEQGRAVLDSMAGASHRTISELEKIGLLP
jgi:3-deoxy-D-manno-octulosonic-acid transferase